MLLALNRIQLKIFFNEVIAIKLKWGQILGSVGKNERKEGDKERNGERKGINGNQ